MGTTLLRTLGPGVAIAPLSLVVVGVMFVLPGEAAPLPATYAARATGDAWRITTLDLDMSGDPATTDIGVGRVDGVVGATSDVRSHAEADNVGGTSASGASVRRGAVSNASSGVDTAVPVAGTAPSGTLTSAVDLDAATLSARGRWPGDLSCLGADLRLTDSRAQSTGANLVPTAIPGEDPLVTIPVVDIPLDPGDGTLPLPDPMLPAVDLPGLPTSTVSSPTDLPSSELTSILTVLPTTGLTSVLTVLPTLPSLSPLLRQVQPAAASDPVELMGVNPYALEQHTALPAQAGASGDVRGVQSEVIGTMADNTQAAATFFGGEVAVRMASQPRLAALADGVHPGKVTWTPAALTLLVAGQAAPITVPPDGTPISVNYSKNRQVVLTVSAGQVTDKVESPAGTGASAKASVVKVTVTDGDHTVLVSDLFPMSVSSTAPVGGVECVVGDSDGDRLTDDVEADLGTDPQDPDTDDDRLKDGREVLKVHTDPLRADTDRDKLKDGAEVRKYRTKPLRADTDRDRLKDGAEVRKYRTNPRKKDTDGDGVSDGREVKRGTDPLTKD